MPKDMHAALRCLQNMGVSSASSEVEVPAAAGAWGFREPQAAVKPQAAVPLGQAAWPSIGQDQEDADLMAAMQVGGPTWLGWLGELCGRGWGEGEQANWQRMDTLFVGNCLSFWSQGRGSACRVCLDFAYLHSVCALATLAGILGLMVALR